MFVVGISEFSCVPAASGDSVSGLALVWILRRVLMWVRVVTGMSTALEPSSASWPPTYGKFFSKSTDVINSYFWKQLVFCINACFYVYNKRGQSLRNKLMKMVVEKLPFGKGMLGPRSGHPTPVVVDFGENCTRHESSM